MLNTYCVLTTSESRSKIRSVKLILDPLLHWCCCSLQCGGSVVAVDSLLIVAFVTCGGLCVVLCL